MWELLLAIVYIFPKKNKGILCCDRQRLRRSHSYVFVYGHNM